LYWGGVDAVCEVSIFFGKISCSLTLDTWFENKILINRNLDENESNLANGVDKYAV